MDSIDISASGLTAQRLRLDVISSNLANVNTTRDAEGNLTAYRRRSVVFATIMDNQVNGGGGGGFRPDRSAMKMGGSSGSVAYENGNMVLKTGISSGPSVGSGVQVSEIAEDTRTPMKVIYDPNHPDANADGYVSLPNVNPIIEMVDMIAASRAYEANVSAIQTAKGMMKSAIDI